MSVSIHPSQPLDAGSGSPQRAPAWVPWLVLGYTLLVILFGAVVRVTGSGAGCGQHWPTCNGEVVHLPKTVETLIEFSHRLTSGLSLLFVAGLLWLCRRRLPRQHLAHKTAWLGLLFLVLEALLGAGLVMFELVAGDKSLARALVMSLHLGNTSLLMLCLTLTAWAFTKPAPRLEVTSLARWLLVSGLAVLLLVSGSGAVTALGDTLYPVSEGARLVDRVHEVRHAVTLVERMRSLHPILALFSVLYLFIVATNVAKGQKLPSWLVPTLVAALLLQLGLGVVNIWLSAPGYMQIVHLAQANVVWVLWVLLCAEACSTAAAQVARDT